APFRRAISRLRDTGARNSFKFKDSLALHTVHDRHRICLDCDGLAEFRVKDCAAESGGTCAPARHLEDCMTSAKTENLESLDQAIVRAAEQTAASVRTARAAIGAVIFGQEQVVEQALITVLAGG